MKQLLMHAQFQKWINVRLVNGFEKAKLARGRMLVIVGQQAVAIGSQKAASSVQQRHMQNLGYEPAVNWQGGCLLRALQKSHSCLLLLCRSAARSPADPLALLLVQPHAPAARILLSLAHAQSPCVLQHSKFSMKTSFSVACCMDIGSTTSCTLQAAIRMGICGPACLTDAHAPSCLLHH